MNLVCRCFCQLLNPLFSVHLSLPVALLSFLFSLPEIWSCNWVSMDYSQKTYFIIKFSESGRVEMVMQSVLVTDLDIDRKSGRLLSWDTPIRNQYYSWHFNHKNKVISFVMWNTKAAVKFHTHKLHSSALKLYLLNYVEMQQTHHSESYSQRSGR